MAMVDTDLFYYKFLFNFIDSSEAFVWKNSLMHDYVTAASIYIFVQECDFITKHYILLIF